MVYRMYDANQEGRQDINDNDSIYKSRYNGQQTTQDKDPDQKISYYDKDLHDIGYVEKIKYLYAYPERFYSDLASSRIDLGSGAIFFVTNIFISSMIAFIYSVILTLYRTDDISGIKISSTILNQLSELTINLIFGIIVLLMVSALFSIFLCFIYKIAGGRGDYDKCFSVYLHASGANILLALPMIGNFIQPIVFVVFVVIGMAKEHGMSKKKSLALMLLALLLILAIITIPLLYLSYAFYNSFSPSTFV